ncbi:hypothetical protein [Stackebrandtia nassauensis]|uniref:PASTA domain-containing protein n=1 Tax=Stackebrandtia nassauensis (strain DSM 44728 / CIP 108903 / NRRL B-16338 / NBRC 102104 / LLR-40K-21) TaxID=446470 RepID=D3Q1X5_STANL|nr:hypothetical protein [Stackebrandtia nassauensis]ADD41842.1 hypothetical protein Snas_2148 [Stackebrandtia nassauensis DSM 44728]
MSQVTPRPEDRPDRSGRTPLILAVVAVIAVVGAVLVLWSPWDGGGPEPAPSGSTSASKGPETSESEPEPSPSDSGKATDDAEVERVPTVIGMPVQLAYREVKDKFSDVRLVADANGAGEACVVFAQDPESGEHPRSTTVTLTYAGTESECGT